MNIVAGEAGNAAAVHQALHKIIALHTVLVSGAIGEMGESGLAQRVFFKLPEIAKVQAHMVADGPIVIFAFDGIGQGTSLRMALDAGVACLDIVHARGVEDVSPGGMPDMVASGTV